MSRFDELGSIETLSIPSIDDDDVYKKFVMGDEENNGGNKKKSIKRREFGEIVEEVIDDEVSLSGSENYVSPRENKYLDEVNQLLGKAKAERENSPTKQTTPDSARFLSKIKKSLEDNLDDVIEESTRLLKEALPMFSYETKQGTRENFSDLLKRQQNTSQTKEDPSQLSNYNFDDIPMMTISKPINEFPYQSSEYRNYEVFESKKNKKLLKDQDHDDISTKFFPHLHQTIQRSTPLKNKRLTSNVVKTPKLQNRDDEYYAKSTEILPSNVENKHVYEMDEDPSPKREEVKKEPSQRSAINPKSRNNKKQPKNNKEKITIEQPKEEMKTLPQMETHEDEVEDKPLIFEYIKPRREIEFASPSSPIEQPEEPIEEKLEELAIIDNSPRNNQQIVNTDEELIVKEPLNIIESEPLENVNETDQPLPEISHQDNPEAIEEEEPLIIQSFEDFKFESNGEGSPINDSQNETIENNYHNENESNEEVEDLPLISRDLENIGFQDIIRELNFTTETILRTCSSSVVDIDPINIPEFIPQNEEKVIPEESENDEPHTPPKIETSVPFSPMIYDQFSPIHNIPSPQSPTETPQPTPTKKKTNTSIQNKKKNHPTPREQVSGPLEESFIPYSGVRHLQKTTYNHSTIDWYLNLCSNKYSRTPSTNQSGNDKGVVKWV